MDQASWSGQRIIEESQMDETLSDELKRKFGLGEVFTPSFFVLSVQSFYTRPKLLSDVTSSA